MRKADDVNTHVYDPNTLQATKFNNIIININVHRNL